MADFVMPVTRATATFTSEQADVLAKWLAKASPEADGKDAKARDVAAANLGASASLIDLCEHSVLFGAHTADAEMELFEAQLRMLDPIVFTRVYLSLFTFPGTFTRTEPEQGKTIVSIDAKPRTGLPLGDYPDPAFAFGEQWGTFARANALVLVFSRGKLSAIMMKPDTAAATPPTPTGADKAQGRDRWTDAAGAQPRVGAFSYVFSKDNPELPKLEAAYTRLEEQLTITKCFECHGSQNRADMKPQLMLVYPTHALVARHSIAAVIREDAMPPANVRHSVPSGIRDLDLKKLIIKLADEFDTSASIALDFESSKIKGGQNTPADKSE